MKFYTYFRVRFEIHTYAHTYHLKISPTTSQRILSLKVILFTQTQSKGLVKALVLEATPSSKPLSDSTLGLQLHGALHVWIILFSSAHSEEHSTEQMLPACQTFLHTPPKVPTALMPAVLPLDFKQWKQAAYTHLCLFLLQHDLWEAELCAS